MNALDAVEVPNFLAERPEQLADADRILLPGVGAFRAAMERLQRLGFADALHEQVLGKGKAILGVCVGMQLMASTGMEFGECPGLSWIPGRVEPIEVGDSRLRLPQIGWNDLDVRTESPLLEGIGEDTSCYFVHSFHLRPADGSSIVATCEYGEAVTAVVSRQNIHGVQFHPEKSQRVGLRVLANFARLRC